MVQTRDLDNCKISEGWGVQVACVKDSSRGRSVDWNDLADWSFFYFIKNGGGCVEKYDSVREAGIVVEDGDHKIKR